MRQLREPTAIAAFGGVGLWAAAQSEGVAEIDGDHREMQKLFAAFTSAPASARPQLVDRLTGLLCAHFDREERLMRRSGYASLERHREAHCFLLEQLNRFAALAQTHPAEVSEEVLMSFVQTWMDDHFASEDKAFCDYLRAG
ncbi:MAG TPA: hemerythrin domain-containing protein [Azospirillaceae bacterium]|nr:hemerythrin domain-containing protein [Azospirillaceae bacterium]HRQ80482.1 hemerythrin domain-containing protein [Azospirillaceae bacterium]